LLATVFLLISIKTPKQLTTTAVKAVA
jgi:hypothetical protein